MEILESHSKWFRGVVPVTWDNNFKDLDYAREPFNNTQDVADWRRAGYSHEHFTGLLCDMRKTIPQWPFEIAQQLGWANVGVSFYRMETCNILPSHKDTYKFYKQKYNIQDSNTIWRMIVFPEAWKTGHYLDIDGVGIVNWRAGEFVAWNNDVEHSAANIGTKPRYTVQITGCKI